MLLVDIAPFVRYARNFIINEGSLSTQKSVRARDNRLFFVVDGQGDICIEDNSHSLCKNTLVIVRSGEKYKIDPISKLSLIVINFDYTFEFSSIKQSFHPFFSDFPGSLEDVEIEDAPMLSRSVVITDGARFEGRLKSMLADYFEKGELRDAFLSATMKALIIDVVTWRMKGVCMHSPSSKLVHEIVNYLKEHYAERVENETLAEHFHFTSAYINRIFKREQGVSVHQYLISLRLGIARELLDTGEYSPSEVSALVGFEDYPHFSKTFKRMMGKSPAQYREINRGGV